MIISGVISSSLGSWPRVIVSARSMGLDSYHGRKAQAERGRRVAADAGDASKAVYAEEETGSTEEGQQEVAGLGA